MASINDKLCEPRVRVDDVFVSQVVWSGNPAH
jgi:hypothetical protein